MDHLKYAGRDPLPRDPGRCDPVDSRPVAAYVGEMPQLSIDQRIREVVKELLGPEADPPAPTEVDLEVIQSLGDLEDVQPLSESEMSAMVEEVPQTDMDAFVAKLTPQEQASLLELLEAADAVKAKASEASAQPQAPPAGEGE